MKREDANLYVTPSDLPCPSMNTQPGSPRTIFGEVSVTIDDGSCVPQHIEITWSQVPNSLDSATVPEREISNHVLTA